MNLKFELREILAWITLVLAFILFSVSISFAQTNAVSVMNKNGKVEIKVEREVNGKTVLSDTSFTIANEKDLDKIVDTYVESKSGNHLDKNKSGSGSKKDTDVKMKKIVIDLDIPEISEKDKEEINEEIRNAMKEVEISLHEAYNSLKKLHIHIDTDEDSDSPENKPEVHIEKHIQQGDGDHRDKEIENLRDSLSDDQFIILGEANENPPTLEKVITSKNGTKVFVFKKNTTGNKSDDTVIKIKKGMDELTIYPNPATSKFRLKFVSDSRENISVKVLNETGKTVFSEKEIEFQGEYSKEIDLSAFEKGTYIVKLSQGKRTLAEKLILN